MVAPPRSSRPVRTTGRGISWTPTFAIGPNIDSYPWLEYSIPCSLYHQFSSRYIWRFLRVDQLHADRLRMDRPGVSGNRTDRRPALPLISSSPFRRTTMSDARVENSCSSRLTRLLICPPALPSSPLHLHRHFTAPRSESSPVRPPLRCVSVASPLGLVPAFCRRPGPITENKSSFGAMKRHRTELLSFSSLNGNVGRQQSSSLLSSES